MGHRREGCPYTIQAQVQGKSVTADTGPMEGQISKEVNVIAQEARSPNLGAKDEFRPWMLVNRRKDRPNSNGPHSQSSPAGLNPTVGSSSEPQVQHPKGKLPMSVPGGTRKAVGSPKNKERQNVSLSGSRHGD